VTVPTRHLGWSIVKNIGGQSIGRLLMTVLRFVVAAIIIKVAGKDSFGEYTLVLSILLIGEWLVDFGLTDICVREVCRDASRERVWLGALATAKLVQFVIACGLLGGAVLVLGYRAEIAQAVVVGCVGVGAYAIGQLYKAHFKCRMQMERDVAAEVLSVVVLAGLVFLACRENLGIVGLVACQSVSRVVYLLTMWALGRGAVRLAGLVAPGPEAWSMFRWAWPLGLSGLCAAVFDQLDTLMLYRLSGPGEVAHYSGAMRFVWPVTVIVQAIAGSVFPILATSWGQDQARFRLVFQRSIDLSVFIAAGAVASVHCGSDALIGLFGQQMSEAALVLRIVVWAVFARAINNALVVSFVIAGGVRYAFIVAILGLAAKALALTVAIPKGGAVGAAYADVICEWLTGVVPMLLITQHLVKSRVDWMILVKTGAAVGLVVGIAELCGVRGTWIGLGIGVVGFPVLALAFRSLSISELKMLSGSVKGRFAPKAQAEPASEPPSAPEVGA